MHGLNEKRSLFGKGDTRVSSGDVMLHFHPYRYFPYEKELARREVQRVCGLANFSETEKFFRISEIAQPDRCQRLTYVAEIEIEKKKFPTTQFRLEQSHRGSTGAGKRQATRYSVHGLHEYRGRFNPQVVRFLLNYFGATPDSRILDPFCGSGTTLAEVALHGCSGTGIDMNPLAVFICNAKLLALATPTSILQTEFEKILAATQAGFRPNETRKRQKPARLEYLEKWFPHETLRVLEQLREAIHTSSEKAASIFLSLASDLLRDYSLQEPSDLRIRRRTSPMPTTPFIEAFRMRASSFIQNLSAAQNVTGLLKSSSKALLADSRELAKGTRGKAEYDFVITSPPYATAMPYIDTQRLSLVWLGLCSPEEIRQLESDAIGSREIHGLLDDWNERLSHNADELPESAANYCNMLYSALGKKDGFRRQAVPANLYRYFAHIKQTFFGLKKVLKKNGQLAFVIGTNHTTLGGVRFEIDTPNWWGIIAEAGGFEKLEVIKLQTYQRYGLHQKNSINGESLTIFRAP